MSVVAFNLGLSQISFFLSHDHRKMLKSFQIVSICICMFISILNVLYYIDVEFKPPLLYQIWVPPAIELIFQREQNLSKYISRVQIPLNTLIFIYEILLCSLDFLIL